MPKPKSQPRNSDLAQDLAVLTERVDKNHEALCKQFEAGMNLVIEKLKPIEEQKKELGEHATILKQHSDQISYWRGAVVVANVFWAAIVGAAVAIGAALVKRGH
jgi:hypothetical protein